MSDETKNVYMWCGIFVVPRHMCVGWRVRPSRRGQVCLARIRPPHLSAFLLNDYMLCFSQVDERAAFNTRHITLTGQGGGMPS